MDCDNRAVVADGSEGDIVVVVAAAFVDCIDGHFDIMIVVGAVVADSSARMKTVQQSTRTGPGQIARLVSSAARSLNGDQG